MMDTMSHILMLNTDLPTQPRRATLKTIVQIALYNYSYSSLCKTSLTSVFCSMKVGLSRAVQSTYYRPCMTFALKWKFMNIKRERIEIEIKINASMIGKLNNKCGTPKLQIGTTEV